MSDAPLPVKNSFNNLPRISLIVKTPYKRRVKPTPTTTKEKPASARRAVGIKVVDRAVARAIAQFLRRRMPITPIPTIAIAAPVGSGMTGLSTTLMLSRPKTEPPVGLEIKKVNNHSPWGITTGASVCHTPPDETVGLGNAKLVMPPPWT